MLKPSASNSASLSVTPAKAAGDASRISLSALSSYALSSDLARSTDTAMVTLLVGEREGHRSQRTLSSAVRRVTERQQDALGLGVLLDTLRSVLAADA